MQLLHSFCGGILLDHSASETLKMVAYLQIMNNFKIKEELLKSHSGASLRAGRGSGLTRDEDYL